MINETKAFAKPKITSFEKFVKLADYSLMDTLRADPDSTHDGGDHWIYIAKVIEGQSFDGNPLIYYGGYYSSVNSKS